jgi:hypothetical protein
MSTLFTPKVKEFADFLAVFSNRELFERGTIPRERHFREIDSWQDP